MYSSEIIRNNKGAMARASDLIFSDRTGNSADTVDTQKAKSSMLSNLLVSSSGQIWKSRISWRIILAVFLTILTVQAIILNFRLKEFETGLLDTLRENGRAAIAPLIVSSPDTLASPFTDESIERLFSATSVSAHRRLFQPARPDQDLRRATRLVHRWI
jgi:hypothetical protein